MVDQVELRSELLQLAERCEQAAGPDRELDMLIECALKGVEVVYTTEGGRIEAKNTFKLLGWIDPGKVNRNFSPYGGEDRYPRYTTSLDAAMTLVPEGKKWMLQTRFNGYHAEVAMRGVDAVTPALAICAAALRARTPTTPERSDG